jgi:hypothetical protein
MSSLVQKLTSRRVIELVRFVPGADISTETGVSLFLSSRA